MCFPYYLLARAVFGRGLGRILECFGAKNTCLFSLWTSDMSDFMAEPPPCIFWKMIGMWSVVCTIICILS